MMGRYGMLVGLLAVAMGNARVWGDSCKITNWFLTVQGDSDGVALFQTGERIPFAVMPGSGSAPQVDDKGVMTWRVAENRYELRLDGDRPFVRMNCVLPPGERVVQTVRLPEIRLHPDYAPDAHKALGTGGLTAVDGHSGSYMFLAVARPGTRRGVVAAWLTSDKASGIVFSGKSQDGRQILLQAESQYGRYPRTAASPEEQGEAFLLGAFNDCREGLERYAEAIAAHYRIKMAPQLSGFCTWYSNKHGGCGDERSTRAFADAAAEKLVPYGFNFFQIDDGWQSGQRINGPKKNFTTHNPTGPYPSGMAATADYLKGKGIRAGIWFMPFSGNWNDPYYADKQSWFVRSAIDYPPAGEKNTRRFTIDQKRDAPYETFWGGTSLDMTDPDVERYVADEVARISKTWGYGYFKYDGMWTAMACEQLYVNDGYLPDDLGCQIFDDPTKTNVECFRKGLQMVRDAAGEEVFILGCNVSQNMRTMGAAYGLVNAMRSGPDNGANWSGICAGPVRGSARYFYNGRVWYNDPDPVYVRNSIPLAHARAITSWAAITGQLFAFSDWLPELSDERVAVLQKTLAPHRSLAVRPIDLFEQPLANAWLLATNGYAVVGLFNWKEKESLAIDYGAAYAGLDPEAVYTGYDFWEETFVPPFMGRLAVELPPASCRVLSLRKLADRPVLVGTSRHVASPVFEVEDERWSAEELTVSGTSAVVARDRYELRFVLPEGIVFSAAETATGDAAEVKVEGPTLRVAFTPARAGRLAWRVRFKKGAQTPFPLQRPTGFRGSVTYQQVKVSWDAAPNFGYRLTRTDRDGNRVERTVTGTGFEDRETTLGNRYRYALQARGWDGSWSPAAEVEVTTPDRIVIPPLPPEPTVALSDLKPVRLTVGWGQVTPNRSIAGKPLTLNGQVYPVGVGVHAPALLVYDLPKGAERFVAVAGLDDFHKTDPRRSVIIRVYADVCEMGEAPVLIGSSPLLSPETVSYWHFDLPIEGRARQIRLVVDETEDGIACDHVDFVRAGFVCKHGYK